MNRMVTKPTTLSDGTVLPAGARIMISDDKAFDPTIYPDPHTFDMDRFTRMREQPGEENRHQFVTTSSSMMGFGHGQHACPGRFFASNEIKIALCFILLRYDFRYIPGESRPDEMHLETISMASPKTQVQLRRRREEIDLVDPKRIAS